MENDVTCRYDGILVFVKRDDMKYLNNKPFIPAHVVPLDLPEFLLLTITSSTLKLGPDIGRIGWFKGLALGS